MRNVLILILNLLTLNDCLALGGSQREAEMTDSLRAAISVGRWVSLEADGESFSGIYTEAEKTDNRVAAVILHDIDGHPDQKPLIHELRTSLPLRNVATLSIWSPLRETGADSLEYLPLLPNASQRITAAVEYLKQQGGEQIVLIGYGLGAHMAAFHLSAHPENLAAFVAISMPVFDDALAEGKAADLIPRIALPFLDVYAEFDLPSVQSTARPRRMMGKDNPVFRQLRMENENHAYDRDTILVVKRIYSWLATMLDFNKP